MTFNMANLPSDGTFPADFIGPLLDDGAPYSGIGLDEFIMIQPLVLPAWSGTFDPLPEAVRDRPF